MGLIIKVTRADCIIASLNKIDIQVKSSSFCRHQRCFVTFNILWEANILVMIKKEKKFLILSYLMMIQYYALEHSFVCMLLIYNSSRQGNLNFIEVLGIYKTNSKSLLRIRTKMHRRAICEWILFATNSWKAGN